jgi:pyruvate/2-oxoglutarate/acetoin dehydrogenase E1 component
MSARASGLHFNHSATMRYLEEVKRAMAFLAEDDRTIFIGQSVAYPGNAIYGSLKDIPAAKKLELPVFEETQMGLSTGLALEGFVPVSIFPRFNFLLLAANQLVNHLDKIPHISHGGMQPKVIIKVMVGSARPLDPGIQHKGNFIEAFRKLVDSVIIEDLTEPGLIFPAYERALVRNDGKSTILVEYGDYYGEK